MNSLKLNQLNKQKVAEREMRVINGGTEGNNNGSETAPTMCQPLNGYGYFRAQMEYGVVALCNPLNDEIGGWDSGNYLW